MPLFQPDINHQTAATLGDLIGGGTAMQYISEQNDMRRQMNPINKGLSLADLDRMQQANEQSRIINPFEADIKRGEARQANSKNDAYYQGINRGALADARSKGVKADIDEATKGTSIQTTNSENKLKAVQNFGKEVANVASYIGTLPLEERTIALTEIAGQHPEIAKSPVFQQLMKLPPDKLQPVLAQISERMIAATPELFNARQIHRETNASHEKVAGIQASASRYATDARKKDEGAAFARDWLKADDFKKAGYLDQAIQSAEAAGENKIILGIEEVPLDRARQLAKTYTQRALLAKEIGAPKPQVPGMAQTNPAGTALQNIYPSAAPLADPLGLRK